MEYGYNVASLGNLTRPATSTACAACTELVAWRRYQNEIVKLPGAATLYCSIDWCEDERGAVEDTCERAVEALQ